MSDLKEEARTKTWADLLYESFYSGAIGGSIVALFYLAVDAVNGRPLITPSLLGGVMFGGLSAEAALAHEVRLDWVAYYNVVHLLVFAGMGALVTLAVWEIELHTRHPVLVLLGLFAALQVGFFVGAAWLMPGVTPVLGAGTVAVANLLAAAGMTAFLWATHRPEAWARVKHSANLG